MAIYSLHHDSIGRSTHRAGTASAFARYIVRRRAASVVMFEHMPDRSGPAQRWLMAQEEGDRKNARVIDKLMVVLPLDLHPLQRQKLLREFCERITRHRIPWLAAIHDKGKDASNPHAHIIIRDRDIQTGKRFAQFSERGSTDRVRKLWADTANEALEKSGQQSRIDHGRKKDGKPGRHRGPVYRSPPSEVPKGALTTRKRVCAMAGP